jgi:hypothetical protein
VRAPSGTLFAEAAIGLLWLGLSAVLFSTDRAPPFHVGATLEFKTTLVAADRTDAMCGSDSEYAGYRCPLESTGRLHAGASAEDLSPCLTTARQLLLVPGLYEIRELQDRIQRDAGLPRFRQKRFELDCTGDVVAKAPDVRVRWLSAAQLGRPEPAWVIVPGRCRVR